ncbi:hypothetical protein NX722_07815 [Endozoicomonas gorgoniicola]|uniref:Uncharacterized protein n=1 Tax=Endozoicomonas gorgoniicola TaxID=1234144 RepID=A0ABT3MT40_9GAMM|nr:hypothetical protein [Endozoicomonas gorgoniicola]MCW7552555.1 hypothetical protein [Endozoicomonas gorgoniicola]
MADKEKIVNLFSEIVSKTNKDKKEPEKEPIRASGIGQVIVMGGQNTINIYNPAKQAE